MAKLGFAHSALMASLEGFAVAERNLKFAQSLAEMDLDEAAEFVRVRSFVCLSVRACVRACVCRCLTNHL